MADVNANIGVNIDASNALAQLKTLQRQLSQFHTSVAKSSSAAAVAQKGLQKNLIGSINSIGAFSAELRTVKTSSESFTSSLEKNKFSMREYFRYAAASTKTFGKNFTSELDTINKVAEDRVKKLQTQYIKLGRDSQGAMKAIAVMPNQLDFSKTSTQLQMVAQKQAIFNQLLKQGSTNLLNFGKNTQWAGRQLMVGFTIPLGILGMKSAQTFMTMEKAALKFKKVYGDLLTSPESSKAALDGIIELGKQFTKYGIAVAETVSLSAEAAAAGFQGVDLQRQTTEATRLSVLGQIDANQALETTIALQNAFKMSSEDLAGSIDFLNAVENQTVTSLDDITIAIPKVAPVIRQLGGDVKDLTFFITAMKEGGINASEGANALKSGLAALINPTSRASSMLAGLGINIKGIVESNQGDIKKTVIDFAKALDTLDPLNRARAIEQMFGKFQFARLSALFSNVIQDGNQASRVLDLAGSSIQDLAALSERELGMTAASPMNKFKKAIEDLNLALVPVGETFVKSVTPIVEFFSKILSKFNGLSENTKKIITILTIAIAGIGPVLLMTFGLLANGIANIIKLFGTLRNGYLRLTGQSTELGQQTQYMTTEQIEAAAAAHSLNQSHATLTQTFNVETTALNSLVTSYRNAAKAAASFAAANPGAMMPIPMGGKRPKKFAVGKPYVVGGSGNRDSEAAMLAPGETVIPADMSKKYGSLINGIIAGKIPGYKEGRGKGLYTSVDVPGSYDVSHFGSKGKSTGADLLKMVEGLDTALARKIREMVGSFTDGLTKTFTTFDNRVVAQFTEINRDMQYKGKTSTSKARENLTGSGFAEVRDVELQKELLDSGMSIDEYQQVNKKLTKEISKGFDALGNKTEITSEELDKLLRKAYEEVAKTDKRIKKAYDNMQKVTAVTDPRTDSRIAVSKNAYTASRKSGKYAKGMTMVSPGGKSPYPDKSRFGITQKMGDQLGLGHKDAAKVYNQFSNEVKVKLAKLQGDIKGFSTQFAKEAELAGLKTGNSYKTGVDKSGLKDIYVESRQRKSPHPQAAKDGQDDANSYETSREKTTQARRRRASFRPQGPAPIGPETPEGATMLPIVSQPTRRDRFRTSVSRGASRVSSFAGGGRGMALSSAAMMGSQFIPGKAGEVAGQISGVGFAAQAAMQGLKVLPGPAKLAAAALLVGVGVYKLASISAERQRKKIEGLGNTAVVTKDKLKTLGDFFGIAVNSLPSDAAAASPAGLMPVGNVERQQIEALKANEDFQTNYEDSIQGLKKGTKAEARMVLKSLAIQLKGRGFAQEQIAVIVKALQEESGKKDLNLNFKTLGIINKKDLKNQVDKTSEYLQEYLSKNQKTQFRFNERTGEYGQVVGSGRSTVVVKVKELDAAGKAMVGVLKGLDAQFQSGQVSSKDFDTQIDTMIQSINDIPDGGGMVVIKTMLSQLGPAAVKAAKGIKGISNQYKVMLALSSGAISADDPLLRVLATAKDNQVLGRAQAMLSKKLKNFYNLIDFANKEGAEDVADGIDDGTDLVEKKWTLMGQLLEDRKAIVNRIEAFKKLRAAGVDAATASDLVSNADIAKALAEGKVTAAIVEQIKWYKARVAQEKTITEETQAYNEALAEKERLLKRTPAEVKTDDLKKLAARYELGEAIISSKYSQYIEDQEELLRKEQYALEEVNAALKIQEDLRAAMIKPKQDRIDEISYRLEEISFAEEAINEKYDKQSKLLSTIAQMNQDLLSIQKKRVSLADALSSGDISSAASIIMEMRAEQSALQASSQQQILDVAKEQELLALGRIKLEKESRKIQFEILTLQRNESTVLKENADNIQKNIDAIQSKLSSYKNQMENDIATLNVSLRAQFGLSKTQIESALKMIDLANVAGFDMKSESLITNIMSAALGDATKLRDLMKELAGIDPKYKSPEQQAADAAKAAADKAKADKIEAERIAAEQAEAARLAAEKRANNPAARREAANMAREVELDRIEEERIAAEQAAGVAAAKAKLAADKVLEDKRIAAEKLAAEARVKDEKERAALTPAERALADAAKAEAARIEAARIAAEKAAEAIASAKAAAAKKAAEILAQEIADAEAAAKADAEVAKTAAARIAEARRVAAEKAAAILAAEIAAEAAAKKAATQVAGSGASVYVGGTKVDVPATKASTTSSVSTPTGVTNKLKFMGLSAGGMVPKYFSKGGFNRGTDTVPAMLTPGEFVVNKKATDGLGLNNLNRLNNGEIPSGSVYNYKVDVTLNGSDVNPNDVANAVLTKIKQLESRNIRKQGIK